MKKVIFNIKYIAIALLAVGISSCDALLDDSITDYGKGPNLVGFANGTVTLKAEANGQEVASEIPLSIIGPTVSSLKGGEVTVAVSVDPSSTAMEGVNYRLDSNTVTLTPDGGDKYVGALPITIITEGVDTPVDMAPVLNLLIDEVSSANELVINDKTKKIAATIAYTCPFDINDYEGTYLATVDDFGIYIAAPQSFEVVVGPGENQLTLRNVAAHPEGFDLVVDVDPSNGDLTIPKQQVLNTDNLGYTYGVMSWEGTGVSGPSPGYCAGLLDMTCTYTVAAGSFGDFQTVFEKQE